MFGNAPRALWERWYKPDEQGRIELACRSLLIEIDSKKILCETGIGAFFEPKLAQRYGVQSPETHILLKSLDELGIDEKQIDAVILSHLHFDHAGGLLRSYAEQQQGNTELLFPNAHYIVSETAWQRSITPHMRDKASFIPELNDKLVDSQRLIQVKDDKACLDTFLPKEISFIYTQGHTVGQMHTLIQGKKDTVVFCGDLIPGISWTHIPITMGYDRFPEQLINEKIKLIQRCVEKQWLMFFTHDPSHVAARCEFNEKKKVVCNQQVKKLQQFEI